jgi:hypothetical protein
MTGTGRRTALVLGPLLAAICCSSAMAQVRYLDPNTLPPQEREFALHGPLGDVGPTGQPVPTGCMWSRLQVPTPQGLRWVAMEECNKGDNTR